MAEYVGLNARVELEGDQLFLENRSFAKTIDGTQRRRIPLAAIASLQFKDAGMNNGFLRLVLGSNDAVEKPGLVKLADDPDTIFFRVGKQARGMRGLHEALVDVLHQNRKSGIDPATVPYDRHFAPEEQSSSLAREIEEANRRKLSGSRPDIAGAAQVLLDLDEVRQALEGLPNYLAEGESVLCLTSGGYGSLRGHCAILVLTDRQVLILQDDRFGQRTDSLPRSAIQGVAYSTGLTGKLEVYGQGRNLTLVGADANTAPALVRELRGLSQA